MNGIKRFEYSLRNKNKEYQNLEIVAEGVAVPSQRG